jgi:hypothetical protein
MNRVSLGETALDYELSGEEAGEVVALVHHGARADWFRPLMGEPALSGRFLSGGHLLSVENPRDAAEAMAGFFARHPMRPRPETQGQGGRKGRPD